MDYTQKMIQVPMLLLDREWEPLVWLLLHKCWCQRHRCESDVAGYFLLPGLLQQLCCGVACNERSCCATGAVDGAVCRRFLQKAGVLPVHKCVPEWFKETKCSFSWGPSIHRDSARYISQYHWPERENGSVGFKTHGEAELGKVKAENSSLRKARTETQPYMLSPAACLCFVGFWSRKA